jgi:hypothetical protein
MAAQPTTEQLLQDLINTIAQQTTAFSQLGNAIQAQVQAGPPVANVSVSQDSANIFRRPDAFKGTVGSEARTFLAQFVPWAGSQGTKLNHANGSKDHAKWVKAALSNMTDVAAVWATPHLEKYPVEPFQDTAGNPSWDAFVRAFQARFEPLNKKLEAQKAIKLLFQGNGLVAEYAAKFENLAPLTNLSDEDLRQRFYEHLTDHVKDGLALTDKDISTYDLVKSAAMIIDQRLRERRSKVRSNNPFQTRASTQSNWRPTTAATVPVVDPDAMQVDATFAGRNARVGDSFRQEWMAGMRGRCYGCGDTRHAKAQCPHGQSLFSWCGRPGHLDKVCFQKASGKPRSATPRGAPASAARSNNPFAARAAATNPFQTAPIAPASTSPSSPGHAGIQDSLRQLREMQAQNQELLAQVA